MIDAVKSIAANAALEPVIRSRIDCRRRRHLAMKSRIEDGKLWNSSQYALDDLHAFQCGGGMQRSKVGDGRNCGAHLVRDRDGLLEVHASMDDAVPHSINLGKRTQSTHFPIGQRIQQILDDLLSRRDWELLLENDSVRVLHGNGRGITAKLDSGLPLRSRWMIRQRSANFVKAGLLAAGAGVEDKNFHRSRTVSTGQAALIRT